MMTATTGCRGNSDTRTAGKVEIINPTFPRHGTQPARFLASMLTGKQINPLAAWREFGIYRTSDVVLRLRKAGWPIITDDLPVQNTFREECVVGLYSLEQSAIDQAGAEGMRFVEEEREVLRQMRRAT
jgi:hypothetical protein